MTSLLNADDISTNADDISTNADAIETKQDAATAATDEELADAVATAATDATTKANAAQTNAEATAKGYTDDTASDLQDNIDGLFTKGSSTITNGGSHVADVIENADGTYTVVENGVSTDYANLDDIKDDYFNWYNVEGSSSGTIVDHIDESVGELYTGSTEGKLFDQNGDVIENATYDEANDEWTVDGGPKYTSAEVNSNGWTAFKPTETTGIVADAIAEVQTGVNTNADAIDTLEETVGDNIQDNADTIDANAEAIDANAEAIDANAEAAQDAINAANTAITANSDADAEDLAEAKTYADEAEADAISTAAADATAKANAALTEAVRQAKEATEAAVALQAQLQADIDSIQDDKIAANKAAIEAEAATRAAEDALIRAELAEERAERIAADLRLQGEINHNRGRIQTLEDQWNTDPVLGNFDISKVTGQRVRIEVANGVFEDRVARVEDIQTIADRVADNTSRIQRLENAVFVDDKDSALDRLRADLQGRAKSARANNAADYVMTSAGLVDLRAFNGAFTSHAGGVMIALDKAMAYDVLGLDSAWVALK